MPITTRSIVLLAPIVMAACAADWPALEGCDDGCTAPMSTSTTDEALPTTAGIQTVTGDATEGSTEVTGGAESTAGADNTGGANTLSAGETGAASETGSNEALLPEVVAIELPAEVHAAGPVPITVHTKNATSVLVKRDGVDVGELAGAGQDVFVGELAVKGAVDNGTRHVEVIATLGEQEGSDEATFEVKVPEAGKAAWSMPGPLGSRTNRIALTPEGDVIEAGLRIGAGIPRPSLHKRSGFDGSDLWPKKVLLSELEGHAPSGVSAMRLVRLPGGPGIDQAALPASGTLTSKVASSLSSCSPSMALHPEGLVVTGAGCQGACGGVQRIETSCYTPAGLRTWHQTEVSAEGAYGSDVVVDSQGRAIVAGASKQGGVLRGQVFARTISKIELQPLWAHWFPISKESSEALGAARDEYDRVFIGGYVTAGGSPQTRLLQLSP